MRLFIAIELDEAARGHLLALQGALRLCASSGNFSRPENLHLTLAFLGEVPPTRLPLVERAMEQITEPAFELRFGRLGRFLKPGGDVWWVGAQGGLALTRLQRGLCRSLASDGFPIESRPFTPHLTLAREVVLRSQPPAGGSGFVMPVGSVSLMLSEHVRGVLTYTPLHRTALPGTGTRPD